MTEPIVPPQTQPKAATPDVDIASVSSGSKEQGSVVDVSDYLKPSESMPDISNELKDYVQNAESPVPDKEIIKASGENVPVPTSPTGSVRLPEVPERKKAETALKLGSDAAEAWEGMEFIREEDKVQMEVLRARVRELKEKEKAA